MKKLLSLVLAFAMLFAMSVSVSAKTISDSGSVVISYTSELSYTVTIPDSMTIGTDATVSVSDVVIGADQGIAVTVSSAQYNNGWLLSDGTNTVGYTLRIDGKDIENNGKILYTTAGVDATATLNTAVIKTPVYSGEFTDTLTFNVDIVDKDITQDEAETLRDNAFSLVYEIEDDDTLPDLLYDDAMTLKTSNSAFGDMIKSFFVSNDGRYTQTDINNYYSNILYQYNQLKAKVEAAK